MIIDIWIAIAFVIALVTSCYVMVVALTDNSNLRKFINDLIDEDELTAEEDGE